MSEIKIGKYTISSENIANQIKTYGIESESKLSKIDKNGDFKITEDELVDFLPYDNIADIDESVNKKMDYYNKQAAIYEDEIKILQNKLSNPNYAKEIDGTLSEIESVRKKLDDISNEVFYLLLDANTKKQNLKDEINKKFDVQTPASTVNPVSSATSATSGTSGTNFAGNSSNAAFTAGAGASAQPVFSSAGTVAPTQSGGSTSSSSFGNTIASVAKSYVGKLKESDGSYLQVTNNRKEAWCADFVTYVVKQASNQTGVSLSNFGSPSVSVLRSWGQANNRYQKTSGMSASDKKNWIVNNVKPGDIMIQKENGASHTGIVTKVNPDGSFETVEGNTSDQCLSRSYLATSKKLSGFIKMS